jgi:predicted TIM-barrel fold metal-dependent hydrolase
MWYRMRDDDAAGALALPNVLSGDVVFGELVDEGANEDGIEEVVNLFHQGCLRAIPSRSPENREDFDVGQQRTVSIGQLRGSSRGSLIDQVMIIPTDIDTYPWLQNAVGAKAMCKAYNDWAYEYCQEDPERLYFAALLPMQNPKFAVQELYRVAARGCRVGLIRPIDAMGNYPIQPKYEPLWRAMEETGVVYGMHPFPAFGSLKPAGYTEQHSGAELINLSMTSSGLPHVFLTNVQNFQAEAALWVTMVLMSGFFERFPKVNAAVFEASSTWLSFLLDECDKTFRLYRNDRRRYALKGLPSQTFFEHCVTGFEGDEAPPSRLPEFYGDILAWSSDVYHHDGDDTWRALETMRKCELPESYQVKFLGENARKLYNIKPPTKFIRDRVTEIERPDWWPTEDEVKRALEPEAGLRR